MKRHLSSDSLRGGGYFGWGGAGSNTPLSGFGILVHLHLSLVALVSISVGVLEASLWHSPFARFSFHEFGVWPAF